jgi:hypothetical protein
MHDSLALKPLIRGTPGVRSRREPRRRRPVKLRVGKAYFPAEHLAWLRERGLVARIAQPGIESGDTDERLALPRLPRPGRPDLLQEARETSHVRHP